MQTAATVACNLTGVPLAGLSDWSGSLGFDYRKQMGRGELVIESDTNARSGYNSDTSGSRYTTRRIRAKARGRSTSSACGSSSGLGRGSTR